MKDNLILIYLYYYYFKEKDENYLINKKIYDDYLRNNYLNFFKYNYIFIYILINLLKLNILNLLKINRYFNKYNVNNMDNFFLKYKDNKLLVYLETYKNKLLINKIKFNFFYKEKKIKVFLYKNFIFKIEIIIFLFYKDYIEWIKRYKYNEYLDENLKLLKYPKLKILLRNLDQINLESIKRDEKNFIKRVDIINNLNLYKIVSEKNKNQIEFSSKNYWFNFNKNMKIIKLLLLLLKLNLFNKNYKYFKNDIPLFYFQFRKIKHFEITTAYNFYLIGYEWSKSDKLKSETIEDFYWQMYRYGFLLYYYSPLTINYFFYTLIKNKILNIFNILFLIKYKNKKIKLKIINLCWYKLIKIISIDYVKRYLFIFFFFHKIEIMFKLYRHNWLKIIKKFNIKYLQNSLNYKYIYMRFIDLTNLLNFKIYPLKVDVYNIENLMNFIVINKENFINMNWQLFNINNNNYLYYYNLDINIIFRKIYLDLDINIKYDNIYNIFLKYIWKYNMEYIYVNNYNHLIFIKELILKLSYNENNFRNRLNLKKQNSDFLCFIKTYSGINIWYKFYKDNINNWIWTYDFLLIFFVLRVYILDLYFMFTYILIESIKNLD